MKKKFMIMSLMCCSLISADFEAVAMEVEKEVNRELVRAVKGDSSTVKKINDFVALCADNNTNNVNDQFKKLTSFIQDFVSRKCDTLEGGIADCNFKLRYSTELLLTLLGSMKAMQSRLDSIERRLKLNSSTVDEMESKIDSVISAVDAIDCCAVGTQVDALRYSFKN